MIMLLVALTFFVIALVCSSLRSVYSVAAPKEIERRAKKADKTAQNLHLVTKHGVLVDVLLVLLSSISAAITIACIFVVTHVIFATVTTIVMTIVIFVYAPLTSNHMIRTFAYAISPKLGIIIAKTKPVLQPLARYFEPAKKSSIYTKDDLVHLIHEQKRFKHNRIEHTELQIAEQALLFGDKNVIDYFTPWDNVKTVLEDDPIGPIVITELYDTGYSSFPVCNEDGEVTGILHIKDVINKSTVGSIKQVMSTDIQYVAEDASLEIVLRACLKTKQHLLLVVNSQQQEVGVISLNDVISQII